MQRADIAPAQIHRLLQVATAGLTLCAISAPAWVAWLAPEVWVLGFALFCLYWMFTSWSVVVYAGLGYLRLRAARGRDWVASGAELPGWERMHHLVVFPICGEPLQLLEDSLDAVAGQHFPLGRVSVLLAFEARDEAAARKAAWLRQRFGRRFATLLATCHAARPGEVPGKGSNLAFAVPIAWAGLAEQGLDARQVLVTVCDADSRLDPQYLAALTYRYLADEGGDRSLYQPVVLFYANLERLPRWARVLDGLYSVLQLARLAPTYKLVAQSTYSLQLAALQRLRYWDADVVPEDSHTCFKLLFALPGARPRPIYLPVWADAAEGGTWAETALSHYRQARRWSWGVSDVPYLVWQACKARGKGVSTRVSRPFHYTLAHLLWPAHWFVLVVGLRVVKLLAPAATRSPGGAMLDSLAGLAMNAALPCLLGVIALDYALRRMRDPGAPLPDPLSLALWLSLPVLGLLLNVLPALEAHLRLLLGRPLAYEVTTKLEPLPTPAPIQHGALADRGSA